VPLTKRRKLLSLAQLLVLLLLTFFKLKAQSTVDLPGIFSTKNITAIERDGNGFYWFCSKDGNIARWSGRKLYIPGKFSDGTKFPNYLKIERASDGNLYVLSQHGVVQGIIDSLSTVTKVNGKTAHINFCSASLEKLPLSNIEKNNPPEIYNQFKNQLLNNNKYLCVSASSFYIITNNGFYYCANYHLTFVNSARDIDKSFFGIANAQLIVIQNGRYQVFNKAELVNEGSNKLLDGITSTSKANLNTQPQRSLQISGANRIINIEKTKEGYEFSTLLNSEAVTNSNFFYDERDKCVTLLSNTDKLQLYNTRTIKYECNPQLRNDLSIKNLESCPFGMNVESFEKKFGKLSAKDQLIRIDESLFLLRRDGAIFIINKEFVTLNKFTAPVAKISSLCKINEEVYLCANGLYKLNLSGNAFSKISIPELNNTDSISYITPGIKGYIFAIIGSGIYDINIASEPHKIKLIAKVDDAFSLTYDDAKDLLFIIAQKNSVYCYSTNSSKLTNIAAIFSHSLSYCQYVSVDKDGDYWLSSSRGLYILYHKKLEEYLNNPSRISSKNLALEKNTNFTTDINPNMSIVGDSLFMLTARNYLSVSTKETKRSFNIQPHIFLNGIEIDDSLLLNSSTERLPADIETLEFDFDFPSFQSPYSTLEYQIFGSKDTSWKPLPDDGSLSLRNLPTGKYKMQIRTVSENSSIVYERLFSIGSIWSSSNFLSMLWLSIILLLIFILNSLYMSLLRNKTLMDIDTSRKQLFTVIAHDLRSPINSYQRLGETFNFFVKKGDYEKLLIVSQHIERSGSNLNLLLNNLLNWSLIAQEKFKARKEKIVIETMVKELIPIYQLTADINRVTINFNSHVQHIVQTDKLLLSLIVRNLLDNATQNAKSDTIIQIQVTRTDLMTTFILSNEVYEQDKEKLAELISFVKNKTIWNPESSGLGIGLIKKATKEIEAKLQVDLDEKNVYWKLHIPNTK
jgi:signal transduction histidine kinase